MCRDWLTTSLSTSVADIIIGHLTSVANITHISRVFTAKSKSSVSPKTGEKLLTFASDDASFEFHVKVDQICKITFVSTERTLPDGNTKVMRVSRFLNEKGDPMCSLILADSSEDAVKWFDKMAEMNGQEVIL